MKKLLDDRIEEIEDSLKGYDLGQTFREVQRDRLRLLADLRDALFSY